MVEKTATATLDERPQRADARRNRASILKAARACFGAEGIDAQIDDVARRAKVGVGTVYRHFPNKQDLLAALAADHFDEICELGRRSLEVEDPWEAFSSYLHACAQLMVDNRAIAELMTQDPETMTQAAQSSEDLQELVEQIVGRAQKARALRPDVVPRDVPMFMCALGKVANTPGPFTGRERYIGIVLDGLRVQQSGGENLPAPLREQN